MKALVFIYFSLRDSRLNTELKIRFLVCRVPISHKEYVFLQLLHALQNGITNVQYFA